MVAQQRDKPAPIRQIDQHVEHASAVWPSIHVVAERDDRVFRSRLDQSEQSGQSGRMSVDVSDGDGAWWHFDLGELTSIDRAVLFFIIGHILAQRDLRHDPEHFQAGVVCGLGLGTASLLECRDFCLLVLEFCE